MSEWMSVNIPLNSEKTTLCQGGKKVAVTNFPEIEELEKDGWRVYATLGGEEKLFGSGGTSAIVFVLKRE
jgi:hypothetical protein